MSQQIENSLKVSVPDLSDINPFASYSETLYNMLTGKFKEFKELFKEKYISPESYIVCDNEKVFHCRFESRNKPPQEIYDYLIENFSDLEFSYHWYDRDANPSGPAFGYYNYIDEKLFFSKN